MWTAYGDEVEFFVVYIREAHALDSSWPMGGGMMPIVEDPETLEERRQVAAVCMTKLALEPMPALVDDIDDTANRDYAAWPDRLYLIGKDRKIAFAGGPGPRAFKPDELEEAIAKELGIELRGAAE